MRLLCVCDKSHWLDLRVRDDYWTYLIHFWLKWYFLIRMYLDVSVQSLRSWPSTLCQIFGTHTIHYAMLICMYHLADVSSGNNTHMSTSSSLSLTHTRTGWHEICEVAHSLVRQHTYICRLYYKQCGGCCTHDARQTILSGESTRRPKHIEPPTENNNNYPWAQETQSGENFCETRKTQRMKRASVGVCAAAVCNVSFHARKASRSLLSFAA